MRMNKKILAGILLVTLCAVSFTGCTSENKIKKAISDTWSTEIDMSEMLTGTIENRDISDMMALKDSKIKVAVSFYTDDSCEAKVNKEDLESWADKVRAYSKTTFKDKFEESVKEGITEEQTAIESLLEYKEMADIDEYIENNLGMTLDEYVEKEIGAFLNNICDSVSGLEKKGTFLYEKGKISINFEDGTEQTVYYNKEADTLSFAGPDGSEVILKRSR